MGTRLVELADGALVEIDARPGDAQEISGGVAARVDSTLAQMVPLITRVAEPLIESCRQLAKQGGVEEAEIEFGISIEAEGSAYIVKAKSGANLIVRLKPRLS